MNAKQAAEKICDMNDELPFDAYLQASDIEVIIQQCIDDALEEVAVKCDRADSANPSDCECLDWAAAQIREMKSNEAKVNPETD